MKNNKKSNIIKSKNKNSNLNRLVKKAEIFDSDEQKLKMKDWLIYENNSCRYDCFLTLYAFVIKPFLSKEIIEADADLNKLNYITDLLINDPDKKYRTIFWKYIDEKGYDRIDDKVSAFGIISCISGLFRIFNFKPNFCIGFTEDKHCTLCGYSISEKNLYQKSLLLISNEDIRLQTLSNILAYKLIDYTSSCPEFYIRFGIIMNTCSSRLHDFVFQEFL